MFLIKTYKQLYAVIWPKRNANGRLPVYLLAPSRDSTKIMNFPSRFLFQLLWSCYEEVGNLPRIPRRHHTFSIPGLVANGEKAAVQLTSIP